MTIEKTMNNRQALTVFLQHFDGTTNTVVTNMDETVFKMKKRLGRKIGCEPEDLIIYQCATGTIRVLLDNAIVAQVLQCGGNLLYKEASCM